MGSWPEWLQAELVYLGGGWGIGASDRKLWNILCAWEERYTGTSCPAPLRQRMSSLHISWSNLQAGKPKSLVLVVVEEFVEAFLQLDLNCVYQIVMVPGVPFLLNFQFWCCNVTSSCWQRNSYICCPTTQGKANNPCESTLDTTDNGKSHLREELEETLVSPYIWMFVH